MTFVVLFAICLLKVTYSSTSTCYSCQGVTQLADCKAVERCPEDQMCFIQEDVINSGLYNLGCTSSGNCSSLSKGDHCNSCCRGDLCNGRGCGIAELGDTPGPLCYSCTDMQTPDACTHVQRCRSGESCYTTRVVTGRNVTYDAGCFDSMFCPSFLATRMADKRDVGHIGCMICCDSTLCNTHDCITSTTRKYTSATSTTTKPTSQPTTKLLTVSRTQSTTTPTTKPTSQPTTKLTIPSESHPTSQTTKTTAKATAQLTTVTWEQTTSVDGGWGSWLSWTRCPYTCGKDGIQHRIRHCDNPAPQNDGDFCNGPLIDRKMCHTLVCCSGPPVITFIENNTTAKHGDLVSLMCIATNYDSLKWKISKTQGHPYPTNVIAPNGSTDIIITNMDTENRGAYICIAKNSCGITYKATFVDILPQSV